MYVMDFCFNFFVLLSSVLVKITINVSDSKQLDEVQLDGNRFFFFLASPLHLGRRITPVNLLSS